MKVVGPHGTTTEKRGCDCEWCRRTKVQRTKKWRVESARRPLRVEVGVLTPLLADLRRAGVTDRQLQTYGVSARSLVRIRTGDTRWVFPRVAEAVDRAWHDHCAPIERDRRRWRSEPLYLAVVIKYGSLRASPWRRDVTRIRAKGSVSTETAESWAERLELMPSDIWPDWYVAGLEEAG